MLKQIWVLFAILAILPPGSFAQDASEIAQVTQGNSCPNCNLFQADLSYQGIRNIDVSGARLRQADLSLVTMDGVNFSGANLSVANLFGGRFTSANFSNADFSQATLVGAYFGNANFAGADMTGANLSGADLKTARNLTDSQLAVACGDTSTVLPSGMHLPHCS